MKVGFAFLVTKEFHNREHLKNFFDSLDCDIEICVHSKKNARFNLPFPVDYIKSIKTGWGQPSLVKASILLFEHLFDKGCDIVYLMSGDMIPLKRCKKFITRNRKTTFHAPPPIHNDKPHNSTIKWNRNQYKGTSLQFKDEIAFNKFTKQNMFFCISSDDFNNIEPDFSFFQRTFAIDEWFWINTMIYHGMKFQTNINYIYCNPKLYETQALFFDEIPEGVNNKFLFMRKIHLDAN